MPRAAGRPDFLGRTAQAQVERLAREINRLRMELAARDSAIEAARADRDSARAAVARTQAERDEARTALRAAQDTIDDLRMSLDTLRTAATRAAWGAGADEPHPVTYELITVADRLGDLSVGDGVESAQSAAVARWLGNRVRMMLARCDVSPETRGGPVDVVRHEVVGWRPAPIPALIGHVAETVRPGYSWRGQLIRTQQVLAYTTPADGWFGAGLAPTEAPTDAAPRRAPAAPVEPAAPEVAPTPTPVVPSSAEPATAEPISAEQPPAPEHPQPGDPGAQQHPGPGDAAGNPFHTS